MLTPLVLGQIFLPKEANALVGAAMPACLKIESAVGWLLGVVKSALRWVTRNTLGRFQDRGVAALLNADTGPQRSFSPV